MPAAILLTPFEPTVTFERPVEVFALPGDPALYVVEQNQAVVLRLYQGSTTLALDLSDRVLVSGNEEGLLSAEPDPAFSTNGRLWVYYSTAQPRRTILSYVVQTAPGEFDAESEAVVLEIGQPFSNHNGGSIRFGPDGMLYLGVGDGGSSGDPQGNGQDASTLLGSILRIDVRSTSPARPYLVPVSNPLVGGTGVRAEVWAYGLRNPWRMDWDASTGSLWVADVGQNAIEEVSIATAGANLGWKVMEGDRCYNASTCNQTGLTMPVAVYNHQGGRCSITGGPVVRGGSVPEVEGAYLFADYCSGEVFGMRASPVGNVVRIYQGAGNVASIAQVRGEVYLLVFGKPLQRVVSP
ncbi:MAG: PQQ-dependent sugar dehydrogenase [Chloroflexi bacterium]|nr:PQQ-dependent sugar dehydrogenase [Chloroflexota bacterium]